VRRLALVVVAGLALAGCGGSGGGAPDASAQIRSAYEKFFGADTPLSDRVAVLQDGSRFKQVIASFASNPLAKNVRVTVSSVGVESGGKAKVVYTIKFGNTSVGERTGSAVLQNGTWKVGFASLCKLVALSGSTPSACKS
jgi:ABC-type phosphate transport system substrate-binding protein